MSRAWLTDFLKQPDAPKYFGHTKKLHDMKPVLVVGVVLRVLVVWIYAQGGGTYDRALVDKGRAIFDRDDCDECHSTDGKSDGVDGAPNFMNHASVEWIERLIRDGSAPTLFSDHNEMPKFGPDKLSDDDVKTLAAFIARQRS